MTRSFWVEVDMVAVCELNDCLVPDYTHQLCCLAYGKAL